MVVIKDSQCTCANCRAKFKIDWEINDATSTENGHDMGAETTYYCSGYGICPHCGNQVTTQMFFEEYPVGTVEVEPQITEVDDSSESSEKSIVETPEVEMYDL